MIKQKILGIIHAFFFLLRTWASGFTANSWYALCHITANLKVFWQVSSYHSCWWPGRSGLSCEPRGEAGAEVIRRRVFPFPSSSLGRKGRWGNLLLCPLNWLVLDLNMVFGSRPEDRVGKWFVVRIFLFPALASEHFEWPPWYIFSSYGWTWKCFLSPAAQPWGNRADSFARSLP